MFSIAACGTLPSIQSINTSPVEPNMVDVYIMARHVALHCMHSYVSLRYNDGSSLEFHGQSARPCAADDFKTSIGDRGGLFDTNDITSVVFTPTSHTDKVRYEERIGTYSAHEALLRQNEALDFGIWANLQDLDYAATAGNLNFAFWNFKKRYNSNVIAAAIIEIMGGEVPDSFLNEKCFPGADVEEESYRDLYDRWLKSNASIREYIADQIRRENPGMSEMDVQLTLAEDLKFLLLQTVDSNENLVTRLQQAQDSIGNENALYPRLASYDVQHVLHTVYPDLFKDPILVAQAETPENEVINVSDGAYNVGKTTTRVALNFE